MPPYEQLNEAEVIALVHNDEESITTFLEDHEIDARSLIMIYREEKDNGGRKNVLETVDSELTADKTAQELGLDEHDADECHDILADLGLDQLTSLQELARTAPLDLVEAIRIIGRPVREINDDLDDLDVEGLHLLLTLEQATKDRKTLKQPLRRQIEDRDREPEDAAKRLEHLIVSREKGRREKLIETLVEEGGLPEQRLRRTTTEDLEQLLSAHDLKVSEQQEDGEHEEQEESVTDPERERLIEDLLEQGLPEDQLRKASTNDLRNLLEDRSDDEPDKSRQQIIEEAEHDLAALQERARMRHNDVVHTAVDKVRHFLDMDDEDGDPRMRRDDVKDLLMNYLDLPEPEAALKTAHIMRGFVQDGIGAQRRLSFMEVAEELPDIDNPHLKRLQEFFKEMHRAQYAGSTTFTNIDQIIKNCQYVIERIHFSER